MNNATEYFTQLFKDAGLSDADLTSAVEKLTKHDKIGSKLNELVKTATEDYHAQLGRVKSLEVKAAELNEWYGKANPEYQRAMAELTTLKTQIATLTGGGGGGGTGDDTGNGDGELVSKKDLDAMLRDRDAAYASVIKETARVSSRHAAQFHEELDVDAVEKIAGEKKLSIQAAYTEYVRPRVEQQQKEAQEKWKTDTREEIERDVRSRYRLPVDAAPPATAPIFDQSRQKPANLDSELRQVYESAGKK